MALRAITITTFVVVAISNSAHALLGAGPQLLQQALKAADDGSAATTTYFDKTYTALGDSFSAGFGALQRLYLCKPGASTADVQCTYQVCGKDTGAYPYLWAKKNNLTNSNFRYMLCSGYDANEILTKQVNSADFGTPQLVTLTAGGDDNTAFARVAEACMFVFGQYNEGACNQMINAANNTINNPSIIAARLDGLFQALANKKPRPTVIVMSYVRFWANIDTQDCRWPLNQASPDFKQRMNNLVIDLNGKLKNASDHYNFRYASVDEGFEGHRVCSQLGNNSFQSWFQMGPHWGEDTNNTFYQETSVAHPTYEGQLQYLKALEKAISGP